MHIFAANFKMNKNQEETKEYFSSFFGFKPKCRVMIAVPYTSIVTAAKKSPKLVKIGAQNVHFASSGPYTGEISTDMLKEAGAEFVIVGHSERRQYFGETDSTAALRAKAAQEAGLEVIFCVGETLVQHQKGITKQTLSRQLKKGLVGLVPKNLIVAYEPVWAIGTGQSASLKDIEMAHTHIKATLFKMYGVDVPVIYGGSVNETNVYEICKTEGVDGTLVGGASLEPLRMKELIERGTKD